MWHVEQKGEHEHEGVRALHAAGFELDAVEAAAAVNTRHGSKTTHDFVERIELHRLSALGNNEMAREVLRERMAIEQVLPTSNYFKGNFNRFSKIPNSSTLTGNNNIVTQVLTNPMLLHHELAPLFIVISDPAIRKHFAQLSRQQHRVVIDTTHNVFASGAFVTGIFFSSPTLRGAYVPYLLGNRPSSICNISVKR